MGGRRSRAAMPLNPLQPALGTAWLEADWRPCFPPSCPGHHSAGCRAARIQYVRTPGPAGWGQHRLTAPWPLRVSRQGGTSLRKTGRGELWGPRPAPESQLMVLYCLYSRWQVRTTGSLPQQCSRKREAPLPVHSERGQVLRLPHQAGVSLQQLAGGRAQRCVAPALGGGGVGLYPCPSPGQRPLPPTPHSSCPPQQAEGGFSELFPRTCCRE